MDKYTVDLDQVLNDFEYSELTDQQSKHASERPQSSTAFQPAPIIKHSINNVFHSLNEYLNSEISSTIDKVQLGENVVYDQQILGKEDNKLINDVKEPFSKVNEPLDSVKLGLDLTSNQLKGFNSPLENSVQNERLLKLKNEPQSVDIAEKTGDNYEYVNDRDTLKKRQLEQLQEVTEDVNLSNEIVQSSILELVEEIPDSISIENIGNVLQNELIENYAHGKSNDDLHKTDIQNFSLLDMENMESVLIPDINCTENNIKSNVENVYNDKECDKNINNKADNYGNNEQTNFVKEESFFTVGECETVKTENNIVDISKINEDKDNLIEKTEVNEEKASYDSVNILKNIEDFVIEPSNSPYALGQDDEKNKECSNSEDVVEMPSVDNNVTEPVENDLKLEIPVENDSEVQKIPTSDIEQISQNFDTQNEELLTNNDSKFFEDCILKETTTDVAEESSTNITEESKILVQKEVVGFSTYMEIDEQELNKMLEDLEMVEGLTSDDDIVEEVNVKETENTAEEITNEKLVVDTLVSDSGVSQESDDVSQLDKEKNEPQSFNTEEKNSSQMDLPIEELGTSEVHLKKSKENIEAPPIECLEIEKPSKSKKSTSKIKDKSEGVKELRETSQIPKEPKENIETADDEQAQIVEQENLQDVDEHQPTQSLQRQQSHDSQMRPQDLPLTSTDSKEEPTVRKIDLIGSPGSTPYNNVYINKSIEPKSTQDTDSDYTSSASPTFSDCSTESTSTASTASVEDYPKNSDGVNKSSGRKHRNSEKSGVKNKESKQGDGDTGVDQGESKGPENSVGNSEQAQDLDGAVDNNALHTEENASDVATAVEAGDSIERSSQPTETFLDKSWLGKEAPLWIPDSDAATCLHCDMKFTVLKRRHHCRACGLVLCSKCCNLKFRLEYLDTEARVCIKCYTILNKDSNTSHPPDSGHNTSDSGDSPAFRPNPNNPSEYCSTVSPLQQIGPGGTPPPSVMVPVGVLKRKGSNKKSNKSVMFCDGIAPGSDLTHLDQDFNYQDTKTKKTPKSPQKVLEKVEEKEEPPPAVPTMKTSRNQPKIDQDTGSFIPKSETSLPPTVCVNKTDILYSECSNSPSVVEMLKHEVLTFAITQNLFVQVKLINMSCCINKQAWCFSTNGLINVGSDEIVYLIEYIDEESFLPKDVFFHINNVYLDAVKGTAVKELGLSLHNTSNFLDSKNHAGFVYIRPTFQCLENVLKPKEPYLIGILIHRWETPWAKLFPLRLILRLGAEYRYYPSPLISTRHRDSVFVEIGHTIINLLADFRNFTYTLPQIRGLIIHMEDKKTTISIPRNRYDQVMKSINNSSEHILAFAGNFSSDADSHLVCIQDTQGHENAYTTHAINIHNKPRKITGASFIVFNGSLKSTSGLTAKSNIVEDGLMIQIPSEHMDKIRDNLRNMKNHTIACGCINATSDETVNIVWGENDVDFNTGAQSPVDLTPMKGVPSIRVHNGKDYFCNNGARLIRWTEVFILQNGEENPKNQDPVDISKVSESIAKACCMALVKYLDLLVSNSCQKIGIRATLHVENVSYSAGSNGLKLPPIYMRSLDNELIPILHKITSNNLGDNAIELELIFRILNA